MNPAGIKILKAFIQNQSVRIEVLHNKITAIEPSSEDKSVHLAYELHNLYCAYEDLFKEIAKTFENEIENVSQFHKDLLTRMQLNIISIRPAIISGESFDILSELLAFRHVFRHGYNYNLNPQKISALKNRYLENYLHIKKDLENFQIFLDGISG